MEYHKVTTEIISLLKENSCWFEVFEHDAVRTSEEAAKIRTGYSMEQGAKALIMKVKVPGQDPKFCMFVMPAHLRLDSKSVKQLLGAKDLRFATEDEVIQVTKGVQPGGVPPFGNLFGIEVIADPKLFENEKIIFNAGDRRVSVAMYSRDYNKLVSPRIESITQQ